MSNYSETKIKEDIEEIAAGIEELLNKHIDLMVQIKENLRKNLVFSCNKRLSESDYSYYETMKDNIVRHSKDLPSWAFKGAQTGQQLSVQLQEIKDFKAMSAKIQKAHGNSIKQAEEVKKQAKNLLETFELSLSGLLPPSDMTSNIPSLSELDKLHNELKYEPIFNDPVHLEISAKDHVPVSTIWKGAVIIEEYDIIALGGLHEISLFSWPSLEYLHTNIAAHQKPIYRLGYLKEVQKLVSCSADSTLKLWRVSNNQIELSRQIEHSGPVVNFEYSPKRQALLTAGDFNNVKVTYLNSENKKSELICNFGVPIFALRLFDNESYLAVANSRLGEICVFDMETGDIVIKTREHKNDKPIWFIGYCPVRELLYSSGLDGIVNIWAHIGHGKLEKRRKYENVGNNITELGMTCYEKQMAALVSMEDQAQLVLLDIKNGNTAKSLKFSNMNSAVTIVDKKRKQLVLVGNSFEGNVVIITMKEK